MLFLPRHAFKCGGTKSVNLGIRTSNLVYGTGFALGKTGTELPKRTSCANRAITVTWRMLVYFLICYNNETQMRYFIDAEFNGFGGQLISLALVPEDRDAVPFYEALPCTEPEPGLPSTCYQSCKRGLSRVPR
jgi:hypothetical protein